MNYEELKEALDYTAKHRKEVLGGIPQYYLLLSPKIKTLLYQM